MMERQTPRRRRPRAIVIVALALLGSLALLGAATPASAHADLIATSPRPDQVLAAPPPALTLSFSAAVDLRTATVQILEPDGAPLAAGAPAHLGTDGTSLTVALPTSLAPGTRTVQYRVVSTDGHPVQGSFRFSVGVATASATPDALISAGSPLGIWLGAARWVAFAGLALAVGTLLLLVLAWPGGLGVASVRRMLWAGLGALAAASTVSLLLYGPYVEGHGLSKVASDLDYGLSTRIGTLLLVRLLLILAAVGALLVWFRRSRSGFPPVSGTRAVIATLVMGGALALTWSLATHSADGRARLLTLPVDVVHMLAMSAWLGGMPALLVLLRKVRDREVLATAVPVFSRTATLCVLALVATGLIQSWRQVGSADALTSTRYGDWLMVKVGLVAAVVAVGGCSRRWVGPRLAAARASGPSRLGRLVAVETGLGSLVLAVTATLVATQPAEAAHKADLAALSSAKTNRALLAASPTDATIGFRLAKMAAGQEPAVYRTPWEIPAGSAQGRGFVQAVISPAFGGLPNELHVSVTDVQGRVLPVGAVLVDLRAVGSDQRSGQTPLSSSGQGHFFSAFTVPRAGPWELGLTVRDVNGEQAVVIVPFEATVSAR